ncbi:hypothetical protein, partial [Solemya velesiana gill symbiont]|uniref:hypothetical protein n=1 Tax=Solemya velesiana gill symbiont TaxID=1918948 RepID=UPI001C12C79C
QRLRPFVSWKSGRIESGWYNRAQIRDYFNSLLIVFSATLGGNDDSACQRVVTEQVEVLLN